jgi:hypothetical protein
LLAGDELAGLGVALAATLLGEAATAPEGVAGDGVL